MYDICIIVNVGDIMNYAQQLKKLIESNNGFLLTKAVNEAKIPREYISLLVKEGKLSRLERGVYVTIEAFDDEMYRLQSKYPFVVFSHDTSLFLHDLTDRDPLSYTITVPTGYNASKIKASGVTVFSIKRDLFEVGLMESKTMFGRTIRSFNMERTICDVLRCRNQLDIGIITDALKRYTKRRDKNLPLLMRYADIFRVTKILRSYMEVLL